MRMLRCLALAPLLSLLISAAPGSARAGEVLVAVASNFRPALEDLARRFEAGHGHAVLISAGATGKHYAQIVNGAPFDLFLAADVARPARLEAEGRTITGSRFTYAIGRLVLWSPEPGLVDAGGAVLLTGHFRHLAIANPRLAPYGRAARQALEALGAWEVLHKRLVLGENIGQTFQFVYTGNAELGLVAAAQARNQQGSAWQVPANLHEPIEQQAVLLQDTAPARAFLEFLRGAEARQMIRAAGYEAPP